MLRVIAIACAYNEAGKIERVVEKVKKEDCIDELLVVDDGSFDNTRYKAEKNGATVISHTQRKGAGAGLKTGFRYALENGFDIIVILAGNDKDNPSEISCLIDPILYENFGFVQGSRYLDGGSYGRMPLYRLIATKYIHPALFSLVSGMEITDSTNGFRAFRTCILKDKRINVDQDWLDRYELEPYLFYKAIKLGYRVKEVPVSKIYPPKDLGYTKMKPILGWWSILKPLFFLGLGLRK